MPHPIFCPKKNSIKLATIALYLTANKRNITINNSDNEVISYFN
jgi:hypothetical protein